MEKRNNIQARFKIGDKAVYPGHGVAQITGLENREIAGIKKEFYVLKTIDSDIKLLIPVEAVSRTGLRGIIGKKEVESVLRILKTPFKQLATQSWNRRQREYSEMLNSGSVIEIAKVLRELHRPESEKELSYSERRVRDQAKGLLVDEIALACKCNSDRAEEIIDQALDCEASGGTSASNPLKLLASHRAC